MACSPESKPLDIEHACFTRNANVWQQIMLRDATVAYLNKDKLISAMQKNTTRCNEAATWNTRHEEIPALSQDAVRPELWDAIGDKHQSDSDSFKAYLIQDVEPNLLFITVALDDPS